ncbi:MAG: hypothetical protein OXH69_19495 [Acidobacteria bacterium]|nr:hypothetical protein [Acidobacteriota bacterium]
MKQPTDAKTIDGPIASLGTYIDLELALNDALGDRLHRTSTGAGAVCHAAPANIASSAGRAKTRRLARTLARRLEDALRKHPGAERIAMTLHRLSGQ